MTGCPSVHSSILEQYGKSPGTAGDDNNGFSCQWKILTWKMHAVKNGY
jgi:hypothetical protein